MPQPITTAPGAPTPIEDIEMQLQTVLSTYGHLIMGMAPFLVDHFTHPDLDGKDFRDFFIDRNGISLWQALKRDTTPEIWVELAGRHDALSKVLTPPEKFRAFMVDFFADPVEEEDDEDSGELAGFPAGGTAQ